MDYYDILHVSHSASAEVIQNAYRTLAKKYHSDYILYNNKGIAFLKEHYEIEHTLSMQDAIDDLTHICRRNGGAIQNYVRLSS